MFTCLFCLMFPRPPRSTRTDTPFPDTTLVRSSHEEAETRRIQVLETFAQTERTVAAQAQSLADAMQKERLQAASMSSTSVCLPYAEHFLPNLTRDFRELLDRKNTRLNSSH